MSLFVAASRALAPSTTISSDWAHLPSECLERLSLAQALLSCPCCACLVSPEQLRAYLLFTETVTIADKLCTGNTTRGDILEPATFVDSACGDCYAYWKASGPSCVQREGGDEAVSCDAAGTLTVVFESLCGDEDECVYSWMCGRHARRHYAAKDCLGDADDFLAALRVRFDRLYDHTGALILGNAMRMRKIQRKR